MSSVYASLFLAEEFMSHPVCRSLMVLVLETPKGGRGRMFHVERSLKVESFIRKVDASAG